MNSTLLFISLFIFTSLGSGGEDSDGGTQNGNRGGQDGGTGGQSGGNNGQGEEQSAGTGEQGGGTVGENGGNIGAGGQDGGGINAGQGEGGTSGSGGDSKAPESPALPPCFPAPKMTAIDCQCGVETCKNGSMCLSGPPMSCHTAVSPCPEAPAGSLVFPEGTPGCIFITEFPFLSILAPLSCLLLDAELMTQT